MCSREQSWAHLEKTLIILYIFVYLEKPCRKFSSLRRSSILCLNKTLHKFWRGNTSILEESQEVNLDQFFEHIEEGNQTQPRHQSNVVKIVNGIKSMRVKKKVKIIKIDNIKKNTSFFSILIISKASMIFLMIFLVIFAILSQFLWIYHNFFMLEKKILAIFFTFFMILSWCPLNCPQKKKKSRF